MGARTLGREAALQILFGVETTATDDIDGALGLFWREFGGDPEARAWAEETVRGVAGERAQVDQIIGAASEHWRIERMTRVDRNVLRIGAWELCHRTEVPRAVILDEAVELAKKFGSEDSGAFVNGVLDRIAENTGRVDTDR
jgi:N utilization substance protein B